MLIEDTNAKGPNSNMVDVYDFKTKTVSRIPARELAPYMVRANIEGVDAVDGPVWVDAREMETEVSDGLFQHPTFDRGLRDLLREIRHSLWEVRPLSLQEWEDGFRRDRNAELEIAMWLHLARVYQRVTTEREMSMKEKQDYFRLFLACLNAPREHVLKTVDLKVISTEQVEEAMSEFYSDNPNV